MTRGAFFLFIIVLFSCKTPCRKITTRTYCKDCPKQTLIRTYLDCSDSTSFVDSTFEGIHLWHTGEIANKKRNGTWAWFDTLGRVSSLIIYDNDVIKKRCDYKKDGLDYCTTYNYQNDSVVYIKRSNSKDIIFAEGLLQNDYYSGQWIFYDTVKEEKIIANYFPASSGIRTWPLQEKQIAINYLPEFYIAVQDTLTGELMCVARSLGILNGQWVKYDRSGKVMERKTFEMGKEK